MITKNFKLLWDITIEYSKQIQYYLKLHNKVCYSSPEISFDFFLFFKGTSMLFNIFLNGDIRCLGYLGLIYMMESSISSCFLQV